MNLDGDRFGGVDCTGLSHGWVLASLRPITTGVKVDAGT